MSAPAFPIWRRLANNAGIAVQIPWNRRAPYAAPEEIASRRDRRVRSIVRYAWQRVPFYRKVMDERGLTPEDFQTASDLVKLPLVNPKDVHLDLESYTAQGVDRRDWLALDSSGSTGTSRVVFVDEACVLENVAHGARDREVVFGGRERGAGGYREVCIGSYASTAARIQAFVARRIWLPPAKRINRVYISMQEEPIESLNRSLTFGAHLLAGSGSYVTAIASAMIRSGGARPLPMGFVVASEAVTTKARDFLVNECGARLVSVYGAVEALKVGFSCEHWTGIHINDDLNHVRLVDDGDTVVPHGESGEVVVSNLVNRATVLLNYRLMDMARWAGETCACGRTLPLLSFPEGRVTDWVVLPGGGRLHSAVALATVQDLAGVLEFQVTQRGIDDFEVLLVADGNREWSLIADEARANFRGLFGEDVRVAVRRVDRIERDGDRKRRLWVVLPNVGA